MTAQGRFELRDTEGFPIVSVRGDLDITNAVEFERTLREAAGVDRGVVIVSLAEADYFDSKGIHVLLDFAEHLNATRRRLFIVAPRGESPRRVLEFAGVAETVSMFDSLDEAVRAGRQ